MRRRLISVVGQRVDGLGFIGSPSSPRRVRATSRRLTRAELLAEIEGRSLSEAEIEEREGVARALCQMDDDVLRAVWADMDSEQLAFQDFVFTQECGDRNPLYADIDRAFRLGELAPDRPLHLVFRAVAYR